MVRYGKRVKKADLNLAYTRTGMSFGGQMKQNFITLTDNGDRRGGFQQHGVGGAGGTALPVLTGGNKRPFDNGNKAKKTAGRSKRGGRGGGSGSRGGHTQAKKCEINENWLTNSIKQ